MTAREAVERFVNDGDTIYSGFNIISFALTNEIIRQGKKGLKAVAGSVTPNVTMMSIDGNVNRIETKPLGSRFDDVESSFLSGLANPLIQSLGPLLNFLQR